MKKFIYHNSLSIVFFLLFVGAMTGQIIFGFHEYNNELIDKGAHAVLLKEYFKSGHFLEATFENWESEFLQMGLFVWFTIFLKQKGSSESKGFGTDEEVDREPSAARKGAPWPVKKRRILVVFIPKFAYYFINAIVCSIIFFAFIWKF